MQPGILTIAAAIARRRAARMGRKAARKAIMVAAAGYLAVMSSLAAFGFLLWALWAYLRPLAGPIGTPLSLAGVCLLLALIFALVITSALRKPKRARYDLGQSETALAVEAQTLISKQKLPILMTVALMGLVAGSQKR
jgi:membrane protein YdbS with pleckstrin-like domain